jgi:hypothetical protein
MKNKVLALFLIMISLSSCNDFLDFKQEVEKEAAGLDYSDPDNLFKPVSAAYASLRLFGVHGFSYIGMFEITSDNADKGSVASDSPAMKELDEFTYGANNELIALYWADTYTAISSANNALNTMPLFKQSLPPTDTAKVDPLVAEVKVLRAYYYFNLNRAYGGVPLVKSTVSSEELNSMKRATQQEVYKFIETELKWAINKLPDSFESKWAGRINKYTAMALLAKVAMYQEKWDEVKSLTSTIISYAERTGKFGLYPDFYYLFRLDGENSIESLFEVQASYIGKTSGALPTLDYCYLQGPRSNSSKLQGWGFCTPSTNLVEFFNLRNDKKRSESTLLYSGKLTPYGDSIYASSPNPIYNGKAYAPASQNLLSNDSYGKDNNLRLLRYADVLLMNAEACFHEGGDVAKSLNAVRNRVGLIPIGSPTLQNIWDERRAELAMEEDRFLDLVRTGQASIVLKSKGYVSGKHNLFPIPETQRAINSNLTQNPKY